MPYYAQITDGRVTAVTERGPTDAANMVELETFDTSKLNWLYADGVFTEPPPPVPE